MAASNQLKERLGHLEKHLKEENPVLLEVVGSFRELDKVSRRIGFIGPDDSHADRVPWWPLVAVLGTYSSGKSTFINHYLEFPLQSTGNQAVDDKFTVVCFSSGESVRSLPGRSLDADPRFPFYQVSDSVDEVDLGEGQRIDAYLQLKTCPSPRLKGKIFIDSPGFDADAQRTSTLRITDHIIDLSDLVLVFFDARHPEGGSMRDTLDHLVRDTVNRHDSNKFLYVLNQIDTTAREDNPEQVFAAWQRALAQHGLTAGHFYSIYNPEVAIPIEDEELRRRFESKRDRDMAAIYERIDQVSVERSYRIVGMLEQTARLLEHDVVPRVGEFIARWRRRVLIADALVLGLLFAVFYGVGRSLGWLEGVSVEGLRGNWLFLLIAILVFLGLYGLAHFKLRDWMARRVEKRMLKDVADGATRRGLSRAFTRNTRWWRTIFARKPAGWSGRGSARLAEVVSAADEYVQKLNDMYTDPSGTESLPEPEEREAIGQAEPPEPAASPARG